MGGVFADRKQIERFQYEARAASRLVHPNIVPIYEIGEIEGQHFFTMALYEEGTLADQMERFVLPKESSRHSASWAVSEERQNAIAALMATVARAVHHAHQHGVIHRDLKPSNILLDERGEPHVGDFSLAKLSDEESGLTVTGALLGTPAFMSPEQAAGKVKDVGVAADVYGLGAVLYQLLTGRPPFVGEGAVEILRQVREEEPVTPRTLRFQVDADLETICLRCLQKDPSHRYASALEVAEELDRYRRREPIRARPIKPALRFIRWCQRKPALASVLGLLVIALISGMMGITMQRNVAVEANARLTTSLQMMDSQMVDSLVEDGRIVEGLELLLTRLQENPQDSITLQRVISLLEQHTFPLPAEAPVKVGAWARKAIFDAREERMAIVAGDSEANAILPRVDPRSFDPPGPPESVRLWNRSEGKLIEAVGRHEGRIHDLAFHPLGHMLVSGSWDGTAKVWRARDLSLVSELAHDAPVWFARFSPVRDHLITLSGNGTEEDVLSVWDTASWRRIQRTRIPVGDRRFARFSPNGQMLAIGGSIWAFNEEGRYGVVRDLLDLHRRKGSEVAFGHGVFSPDNRTLVTLSKERFAQSFDVLSGIVKVRTSKHFGDVIDSDMSPSGHLFVTGSNDQTARVWMTETGEMAAPALVHRGPIYDVKFSPFGNLVATASADGQVGVWDPFSGENRCRIIVSSRPVMGVQFYEEGKRLVAVSGDGWISFWDVQDSVAWPERVADASELEENTSAFQLGEEVAFIRRTLAQGKYRGGTLFESDRLHFLDSGRGGDLGLSVDTKDPAKTIRDSKRLHTKPIHSIQADSALERVVTASEDGTARVWSLPDVTAMTPLLAHDGPVLCARFSRDGKRLVTASEDGIVCLWNASDGTRSVQIPHESAVLDVRYSDDDNWVSVGCQDGSARVYDGITGEPVTPPLRHRGAVIMTRVLPDNDRLVVGTDEATLRIWDISRAVPLTEPMKMPMDPARLFLSPTNHAIRIGGRTVDSQNRGSVGQEGHRYRVSLDPLPGNPPAWFLEFLADIGRSQRVATGQALPSSWQRLWEERQVDRWDEDFYGRWCQWFLADRSHRTVNPDAELSISSVGIVCPKSLAFGGQFQNPEYHDSAQLARHMANLTPTEATFYNETVRRLEALPAQEKVSYLLSQHGTFLAGDDRFAWVSLGQRALELDRVDESLRVFERAYALSGEAFHVQNEWDKALFESRQQLLEELERKAPRSGDDLRRMRHLLEGKGSPSQVSDRSGWTEVPKHIPVEITKEPNAAILGLENEVFTLDAGADQSAVVVKPTGVRIPEGNFGLELDGHDDLVKIGYLPIEDGAFTVEAWIKTESPTTQVIVTNREGFRSWEGAWLSIRVTHNVPEIYFSRGGRLNGKGVQARSKLSSSWNHIAVIRDRESVRWYINGNLDHEQDGIPIRDVSLNDGVIGAWSAFGRYFFEGSMDEFRLWSEARTAEEIRSNMNRRLAGNESHLVRYYPFDDGPVLGETGEIEVVDWSPSRGRGTFLGGTLDGPPGEISLFPCGPGAPACGDIDFVGGLQLANDRNGSWELVDFLPVGVTPVTWALSSGGEVIAEKTIQIKVERSSTGGSRIESRDR